MTQTNFDSLMFLLLGLTAALVALGVVSAGFYAYQIVRGWWS